MCYACFMVTRDDSEELNQNNDYMSCVTGITGITGTTYFTQNIIINISKEFVHAVYEADSKYKKKCQLWPQHISKTSWTQLSINQVSRKICNILTCPINFGAVFNLHG